MQYNNHVKFLFQGGVKFSTGSEAAHADESASRKADGFDSQPTVRVRMEETDLNLPGRFLRLI